MDKKTVAKMLRETALLMELADNNVYKARAYSNAARVLEDSEEDLETLIAENRLQGLPGIGKALNEKIIEIYKTETLHVLEELKEQIPEGLLDMLQIPGLGPKKIKTLYENLGISSIGELEYACEENRLLELPKFGPKIQEKILKGIHAYRQYKKQFLYSEALSIAKKFLEDLMQSKLISQGIITGSLRRCQGLVRDIDLLLCGPVISELRAYCSRFSSLKHVRLKEPNTLNAFTENDVPVDIHVVNKDVWGTYTIFTTGSIEHVNKLQKLCANIPEKELIEVCPDTYLPKADCEEKIYKIMGLPFIPPEMREGVFEIELAEKEKLPEKLITLEDLAGILHVHTTFSDGAATLEQVVGYAYNAGHSYLGITDHSKSAFYAGGLKEKDLKRQSKAIKKFNSQYQDFTIFHSVESDILPDGNLDYPDDILQELDFVLASVHSHFKMSKQEMTKRIIKAIAHPAVRILGHPTGRLLLAREPYEVDLNEVIKAALYYNVAIEINANPHRLDLDWQEAKRAASAGVLLVINPDAHRLTGFHDTINGINVARKAGLSAENILNTRETLEVQSFFDNGKNLQ